MKSFIYILSGGLFVLTALPASSQIFPLHFFKKSPEIELSLSERRIPAGDTTTFSWTVTQADTFYLQNKNKRLPLKGELSIQPAQDVLYRFVAKHANKTEQVVRRVTVVEPKITQFEGPESVTIGQSLSLEWGVKNARTVRLLRDGNLVDSSLLNGNYQEGTAQLSLDSSSTFTLLAVNQFGKSARTSHHARVRYSMDTMKEVYPHDTTIIGWYCPNAHKVTVNGQPYDPVDTTSISPLKSTNYPAHIYQNNGDTLHKQIRIHLREDIPRIEYFTGTQTLYRREKGKLYWMTKQANNVYLKNEKKDDLYMVSSTGEQSVRPDSTTAYQLKIFREGHVIDAASHKIRVLKRRYVKDVIPYSEVPPDRRIFFEIFATNMDHYPEKVELYVLAVDSAGNFVTHLAPPYGTQATARKFFKSITEKIAHRKKHQVKEFTVREVHQQKSNPSNTSLTLDYSGSMQTNIKKLEASVLDVIKNKGLKDSVSIVRFDDSIALEQPLTASVDEISNNVRFEGLKYFGGSTALYAAIDEGLVSLNEASVDRRMLLFTDGYDNASFQHFGERAIFAQQVAQKAKEAGVEINPISYGKGVNESVLRFLAILTGGNYYNILRNDKNQINQVMKELQMLNHKFYKVTYEPDTGKNERQILMKYANNRGNTAIAKRKLFVGDQFDLTKREKSGLPPYWNNARVRHPNKRPISSPQELAKFDFNKSELKPAHYRTIEKYVKYLNKHPDANATIIGHACLEGTEQVCNRLSRQRADTVYQYMVDRGIDQNRLKAVGLGKEYPIWKKENKDWKARANRRVEIVILE